MIQGDHSFTQLELPLFESDSWMWKDVEHIFDDVVIERHKQISKWGVRQNHQNGTHTSWRNAMMIAKENNRIAADSGELEWSWILLEEVYEALCETEYTGNLRHELIQVAAVVFAWIEQLDGFQRWEPGSI